MSLPKPATASSVVITGASSGIGAEIARGLSRLGYRPMLVARRADRLRAIADELAREFSVAAEVLPLDLAYAGARGEYSCDEVRHARAAAWLRRGCTSVRRLTLRCHFCNATVGSTCCRWRRCPRATARSWTRRSRRWTQRRRLMGWAEGSPCDGLEEQKWP